MLTLSAALLALSLAVLPPALSSANESSLEAELRRQQELLDQMEAGRRPLPEIDPLTQYGVPEVDPRVAPSAPVDRELPVAIFEVSKVRIPAGTWSNAHDLRVERRALDADTDGMPELLRFLDLESGYLIRQEEDRNFDGVTDAWTDYEWGVPVRRVLDSNDDGNPDTWEVYESGRAVSREIDRDDDGVRDALYRYEGGSLVQERHDANNDGRVDLNITLKNRLRVRAEEDQDKDGRIDTWITYSTFGGDEIVVRIERDRHGRGFADTFEIFEAMDGKATLTRMDEDVNGDQQIDVRSIYRKGKLIRREVHNPEALRGQQQG